MLQVYQGGAFVCQGMPLNGGLFASVGFVYLSLLVVVQYFRCLKAACFSQCGFCVHSYFRNKVTPAHKTMLFSSSSVTNVHCSRCGLTWMWYVCVLGVASGMVVRTCDPLLLARLCVGYQSCLRQLETWPLLGDEMDVPHCDGVTHRTAEGES